MNGIFWRVLRTDQDDPVLIDRTGRRTLAVTDPRTHCIWLAKGLYGRSLERVLLHELGHATMVSYGMLPELHRMVRPAYWTEAEEWICNLLADYGAMIFWKASDQL